MRNLILLLLFAFVFVGFKNTTNVKNMESESEVSTPILQEIMDPAFVWETMDAQAEEFLKDSRMTSVSIGIYKDGKEYIRHYGELDRGKGNAPTDETLYEIASVSKTMTGTLVAQAVLDGKLSLEDDIRDYLKEDFPNLEYKGQPIQIQHMLTHTSRLPGNIPGISEIYDNKSDSSMLFAEHIYRKHSKEKLFAELHETELDTFPGTAYTYSNIAPEIIAHILENIYEKRFDILMKEMLFDKAGMPHSCLDLTDANKDDLAIGYNGKDLAMLPFSNIHWGAGGRVKSTMPDMLNYIKFHLDEENPLVKEAHRKIMKGTLNYWRAYYMSVINNGEGDFYSHNGYASGTQNLWRVYPAYNMGVSVITNASFDGLPRIIRNTVIDLVDELKPIGKKSLERAVIDVMMEDVDKGVAYYYELKKTAPEKYNFDSAEELNNVGYELLANGKTKEAIKVFQLLVAEFPEESNPYDSLGEGYYENGQYELSIKNYRKSVELNPGNDYGKEMIKKIEKIMEKK